MRFDQSFLKLPVRFDSETLEREVRALPLASWVPHPTGFVGNEAVRLVTVGGQPTDGFEGPMRPAADLARLPYIQEVMAELDGVWSRSRLMGLGPGAEVPLHVDAHYHWRTHVRIHIPIITDAKVLFTCGDDTVHMAPGECWLFDSFRFHRVENGWTERRVHLVLDTVMTESIHKLVDIAQGGADAEPKYLAPGTHVQPELKFEQFNLPTIMSPWEIRGHMAFIFENAVDHPRLAEARDRLDRFAESWAAVWAQYASNPAGAPQYRKLLRECRTDLTEIAGDELELSNSLLLRGVCDSLIFGPALAPALATANVTSPVRQRQRLAS